MRMIVYGEPRGKGRPRITGRGGAIRAYTPPKTAEYEKMIAEEWRRQTSGYSFGDKAVEVRVTANFGIPKSVPKRKRPEYEFLQVTKKSDIDNIAKVVLDGLNGVAYNDDKQVVWLLCHKRYWDVPSLVIEVKEV